MIKSLSQLKRTLKAGDQIEIVAHCCQEYSGTLRKVTLANTQGWSLILKNENEADLKRIIAGKQADYDPITLPISLYKRWGSNSDLLVDLQYVWECF